MAHMPHQSDAEDSPANEDSLHQNASQNDDESIEQESGEQSSREQVTGNTRRPSATQGTNAASQKLFKSPKKRPRQIKDPLSDLV